MFRSKHFTKSNLSHDISSFEKIRLAYENSVIDEKAKIMSLLHLLFDKDNLRSDFKSGTTIKSGTTALKEIYDYIHAAGADSEVIRTANRYLLAPVPELDKVYVSPSGYFKIHYTLSGPHAISIRSYNREQVPEYIREIGAAFDNVKSITCTTRGFREPVMDASQNTFDVHVYDLKGKYGITFPKAYSKSRKTGVKTASSYISIDNSYAESKGFKKSRADCMKVTAAHEFFHAVQNAYNVDADAWWKEASATWNEDEVYTGINDYVQYLKDVFSAPQKSLEKNSYGGVVFAKYLSENLGGYDIIKRIWEIQGSAYSNSINAIDKVIREKHADQNIGTAFSNYAAYNFSPSQYYKNGKEWNSQATIKSSYTEYPLDSEKGELSHLSANYHLFSAGASSVKQVLRISVDGADKKRWGFKLQKRKQSDGLCDLVDVNISGKYSKAEIVCDDFGSVYKEICLIPSNLEKSGGSLSYTYSATVASGGKL